MVLYAYVYANHPREEKGKLAANALFLTLSGRGEWIYAI